MHVAGLLHMAIHTCSIHTEEVFAMLYTPLTNSGMHLDPGEPNAKYNLI